MFEIRAELDCDRINTLSRFSRVNLGNLLNLAVFKKNLQLARLRRENRTPKKLEDF